MSEALFALAGTLVGVFGTLAAEIIRSRRDDVRYRRETVRSSCADFSDAIARIRTLSYELRTDPHDAELLTRIRDAEAEARIQYERLRLVLESKAAQAAARHAVRYAYGLRRQSEGRGLRDDEKERGPLVLLHEWMMRLYVEVRRETGIPHPEDMFYEPESWLQDTANSGTQPVAQQKEI